MYNIKLLSIAACGLLLVSSAHAEIKVGFVTSMSGPNATVGVGYREGLDAAKAYFDSVGGEKITAIVLDDASDQSTAARNARKLIDEEKVDVLIGTAGVPSTLAMAAVATEKRVPMISLSPASPPQGNDGQWYVSVPQSIPLMVSAIVDDMNANGYKRIAFIGYTDALGDSIYASLEESAGKYDMEIVTDERYARADTSVAAQTIKIISAQPDAVMTGGAGSAGALPYIELAQRGFRKPIYGIHAQISPDFIRVGGASVQGAIVPTGPVVVAEQLPDDNPVKEVALDFRAAYKKANGQDVTDSLSAYAFDSWLIVADAAKRAMAEGGKPGTELFRAKLRDAILRTKELVGTHGVYNFHPGSYDGLDQRGRVMVKLGESSWKLVSQK